MAAPAVSDDEAFDKMRDVVEQQVAELGDKVAALAKRYERDCKAGKAGGMITSLDLAQTQAPRPQPRAEDGLVIFCEFEGVACSIDTEAVLAGEAGGAAEARLKRLQAGIVWCTRTHSMHCRPRSDRGAADACPRMRMPVRALRTPSLKAATDAHRLTLTLALTLSLTLTLSPSLSLSPTTQARA
jgi:hypothetical protein